MKSSEITGGEMIQLMKDLDSYTAQGLNGLLPCVVKK